MISPSNACVRNDFCAFSSEEYFYCLVYFTGLDKIVISFRRSRTAAFPRPPLFDLHAIRVIVAAKKPYLLRHDLLGLFSWERISGGLPRVPTLRHSSMKTVWSYAQQRVAAAAVAASLACGLTRRTASSKGKGYHSYVSLHFLCSELVTTTYDSSERSPSSKV